MSQGTAAKVGSAPRPIRLPSCCSIPDDHADPQATAETISSVVAGAGYCRCLCLTYCSREQPATLTAAVEAKRGLFEHYGQELGGCSTWRARR